MRTRLVIYDHNINVTAINDLGVIIIPSIHSITPVHFLILGYNARNVGNKKYEK